MHCNLKFASQTANRIYTVQPCELMALASFTLFLARKVIELLLRLSNILRQAIGCCLAALNPSTLTQP